MPSNYIQGNMSYTGGQNITSGSSALKQVESNVRNYVSRPGHDVLSDAVSNTQNALGADVNSGKKASDAEKSLDDKDRAAWMWSVYMGNGQHGGSGAGSASPGFDYLDAPWASAYGMSPETAYNEAMENTAYRRSVTDMKAAGLNPASIFGAGKGSTAGSPGYISLASPGGSGGSGRGYGRRSGSGSNNGKLFSSSAYSVMSALGGIVGAAATKSAGGYWIGTSLTQGAMNALNALSKWKK